MIDDSSTSASSSTRTSQPHPASDPVLDDPILARALRAVGRNRALGLHFYGHFIGIGGTPGADGRAELAIEGDPATDGATGVSAVALATVADLAIGSAIRTHLEPGCRLGTVTLSVQHPLGPVSGPIIARAEAEPAPGDGKPGRCLLTTADGTIVGHAQGWFAALPPPPGVALSLLPWERVDPPPAPIPPLADLDEQEAAAVTAARAAGDRARRRGTSISDELLHFDWHPAVEGAASGELTIGPELANRVGHIQGGALYGAAVIVAMQALGVMSSALVDGHYQFIRPADGKVLHGEGKVLRQGRMAAFVETRLSVDGRLVGTGLFSFRMPASRS